jgi:gas vesicle protein
MLSAIRTAIKFFTIGLLAGLLLAPRKGEETRKLMMERSKDLVSDIMSVSEGQAPA